MTGRVHLIGIGGIGISALARLLLDRGCVVSGTEDNESPETLNTLRAQGVVISLDLEPSHLPPADYYVYSDAWLTRHEAVLAKARTYGVPVLSYFEALGQIAREYKVVAVAGTHGKTTTTAMLIDIFEAAGLDPVGIVGSLRAKTRSNYRSGKGEFFIVEADEYRRHFLNFRPFILVITNIDADHLDYYRDLTDIQSAFADLQKQVQPGGVVITSAEYAQVPVDFKLKVPGAHNVQNAQAALAVASAAGIPRAVAVRALEQFAGTWRRFEYKGKTETGALVYNDYAHHPAEIRATLAGARETAAGRRVLAVFQPHLYSRTKQLFGDFAVSLATADKVFLVDIYAAREAHDESVSSKMLAEVVGARYVPQYRDLVSVLEQEARPGDLIVIMGAGDIYHLAELLVY